MTRENRSELEAFSAELIDLSPLGCVARTTSGLATSDRVSIAMNLDGAEMQILGEVVRTWRTDGFASMHAGIHFDAITSGQERRIARFLVGQVRRYQDRGLRV